ncbi:MAG: replicative DNA helicase [Bacteroidota bacterium]|jgi:replicative DNA helicase
MSTPQEGKKRITQRSPLVNQPLLDGKLQPQAVELEEAVLGAIMLEKEALTTVIDILQPRSFYKESHQRIFTAVRDLFNASEPVDILTVTNQLKKNGELEIVGGAFYITSLTNRVASAANVEFHARVISEKFIQRELIRVSTETIGKAYESDADVFDLLDNTTKNIFEIVDSNVRKQYDKMSSLIAEAIKQIEKASEIQDGVTGVPSGFTGLDRLTGGWQKTDLLILAARPGMGKTAFVLTIARNAAVEFNRPVAVFSLEMGAVQLVNRLISSEAELNQDKLRKGQLADYEYVQLHERIKKLSKAPLYIDDTPALSIFELRAKARRLKEQNNIELIIIDYLQLMSAGSEARGNREQEISLISRSLKALAKELNIPIIALSQLSRDVEKRATASKKPMLSDLRESGAIEQDADMVMFIYRPEYYGMTEDEKGNPTKGRAEIIVAKHRNGSLDDIPLRFIGQFAKFTDLDLNDTGEDLYGNSSDTGSGGLGPQNDFLESGPSSITLPSKNWEDANLPPGKDISKGDDKNDIQDYFPF